MRHLVSVLLRGVVATCWGVIFLSDNKALYESDMSQVSNKCPKRVFSLSGEIFGCVIDLVDGVLSKCKR